MLSKKSDTARIERISYSTKITLLIFAKKEISSKGNENTIHLITT